MTGKPRPSDPGAAARWPVLVRLALLLLTPTPLLAQATVHVTEPRGWETESSHVVQAGTTLHIAGVALDPSGVRSVLVNGAPARLSLDRQTRGQVRFELDLVVAPTLRQVVVQAQPFRGPAVERRLALEVRAAPAVSRRPGAAPGTDSAGVLRQIPELPAIKVPLAPPPPSPWHHYALRGIAYAVGAGAGLYLASRTTTGHTEICTGPAGRQDCVDRTDVRHTSVGAGLGIAGAAAAVALIDALLTAHRAHAATASAAEAPPRARTGLLPPTIEPDARGARIALLRLTF